MNGVKEEGEGQGEGAPDSSPQCQPDAVSPTLGLGEDDDDPLLEEGEVDKRAMMVAGGVVEFELLRLPPQSKTVRPWTFQQGGRGRRRVGQGCVHPCITPFHACTQCVKVACRMSCVWMGHATLEVCATLSVVQSFVSFHLLSLCPPLPTDNTHTLHCVSACSPVVQFLRVASRCSPTLLTPEVPQPQPTDSSSCRGRGRGGAASTDTGEHNRTTRQHHIQVRAAMEMCVVL